MAVYSALIEYSIVQIERCPIEKLNNSEISKSFHLIWMMLGSIRAKW